MPGRGSEEGCIGVQDFCGPHGGRDGAVWRETGAESQQAVSPEDETKKGNEHVPWPAARLQDSRQLGSSGCRARGHSPADSMRLCQR